jgi:hypothetical protein
VCTPHVTYLSVHYVHVHDAYTVSVSTQSVHRVVNHTRRRAQFIMLIFATSTKHNRIQTVSADTIHSTRPDDNTTSTSIREQIPTMQWWTEPEKRGRTGYRIESQVQSVTFYVSACLSIYAAPSPLQQHTQYFLLHAVFLFHTCVALAFHCPQLDEGTCALRVAILLGLVRSCRNLQTNTNIDTIPHTTLHDTYHARVSRIKS